MRLFKLSDSKYINPDYISELYVRDGHLRVHSVQSTYDVCVVMSNGREYIYRKEIGTYEAAIEVLDSLIELIKKSIDNPITI